MTSASGIEPRSCRRLSVSLSRLKNSFMASHLNRSASLSRGGRRRFRLPWLPPHPPYPPFARGGKMNILRKRGKTATPLRKRGKTATPLRKRGKTAPPLRTRGKRRPLFASGENGDPSSQAGKTATPLRNGGEQRSRAERAACSRPTFHRVLRPGPEPNGLPRHPCKRQDNRRGSDARTSPPFFSGTIS